jgi:hypothetical protein
MTVLYHSYRQLSRAFCIFFVVFRNFFGFWFLVRRVAILTETVSHATTEQPTSVRMTFVAPPCYLPLTHLVFLSFLVACFLCYHYTIIIDILQPQA